MIVLDSCQSPSASCSAMRFPCARSGFACWRRRRGSSDQLLNREHLGAEADRAGDVEIVFVRSELEALDVELHGLGPRDKIPLTSREHAALRMLGMRREEETAATNPVECMRPRQKLAKVRPALIGMHRSEYRNVLLLSNLPCGCEGITDGL